MLSGEGAPARSTTTRTTFGGTVNATTCDLCGSRVADLAHVCTSCAHGLEADLGDVSSLMAEIEVTVTRQSRMGSGGGGGRSTEVRLPSTPTPPTGAPSSARSSRPGPAWCPTSVA